MKAATFMMLLFLGILFTPVMAQVTIRGSVTDRETSQALPYATVRIEGTFRGTITNTEGMFSLGADTLPSTLVFSYIGYEPQRIFVSKHTNLLLNILLRPVAIQLPPIIVDGEDPAVKIMRKVIRKKRQWWDTLQTYQAEAYCRTTFSNDSTILLIRETLSEVYWDHEKGMRERIRSMRQSADTGDDFIPNVGHLPNFYHDDVEVAHFTLINVVHPDALNYYRFRLLGERTIEEDIVFDIAVEPKTKLQPVFEGTISVLDGEYALLGVELKTADHIIFPTPIRKAHYSFEQQFSNFGRSFWLPTSLVREGEVQIGFPGAQFAPFRFKDIYEIRNYHVNDTLPDTVFEGDDVVRIDTTATWNGIPLALENGIVVPLSSEERKVYENTDSIFSFVRALKPRGVLGKWLVKAEDEEMKAARPKKSGEQRYSLIPQVWYNRTEGLHVGVEHILRLKKRMNFELSVGYTSALKRWTSGIRIGNRFVTLNYLRWCDLRYRSSLYPREVTGLFTLFGHDDYFDYFWNERTRISIGHRFDGIKTRVELDLSSEIHTSLDKISDYDLLRKDVVRRENPCIDEGTLRSLRLGIQYGSKFIPFGIAGQRHVDFSVEHSARTFLSSDFSFTRLDVDLYWRIETFLTRRILPCCLDIRLTAGTGTGNLPLQKYAIVDASLGSLSSFGAFKSLRRLPYEGKKHLALFCEHNFRTVPWELLGLRRIARSGIEFLLHGACGKTWIGGKKSDKATFHPNTTDRYHREIGFSINKVFMILRLDFTRRLDERVFYVSISPPRFF